MTASHQSIRSIQGLQSDHWKENSRVAQGPGPWHLLKQVVEMSSDQGVPGEIYIYSGLYYPGILGL